MKSMLALPLLLVALPGLRAQEPADLILHGGLVWTLDAGRPAAQAVALRGEKIVAVGADSEVLKLRGPLTRMVALEGAFVLPGFNDTHVHFAQAARFLEFNIMAVGAADEFVARVEETVHGLPEGEWILGGYWGAYDRWQADSTGGESRAAFVPDMRLVAELTAKHPMLIRRFDGGAFAANTAALRAACLDPGDPRVDGVVFERDSKGQHTGVFTGPGARELFARVAPRSFTRERRLRQTRRALREVARHGVTSLSDMSDDEQLAIYRELRAQGELSVRVHFRPHLENWKALAAEGLRVGSGDEWIRLGTLKAHIDGIMGTSSARFLEPYRHQPGNRGRWRRLLVDERGEFVAGKFLETMLGADAAGFQLSVHAIGDEANHLLLDYLEELAKRNGERERRFRLVHAQVVAPADLERMGELGVLAEVQPFHISDDMRWMEERIGAERCANAYAFRSLQAAGALLCFGTDWPGTSASEYPIDPRLGLYAAVTRQTLGGEPEGGWFPDERLAIEDAIRAYTLNGAHASFEEDLKGSVEVGKLADLVVLSKNLLRIPPAEILTAEVLCTIVGGKIVFRQGEE